jgi:hypothetical protein
LLLIFRVCRLDDDAARRGIDYDGRPTPDPVPETFA